MKICKFFIFSSLSTTKAFKSSLILHIFKSFVQNECKTSLILKVIVECGTKQNKKEIRNKSHGVLASSSSRETTHKGVKNLFLVILVWTWCYEFYPAVEWYYIQLINDDRVSSALVKIK